MAIMIPGEGPREYSVASREDRLYDALSTLTDDFYIVHSMDVLLTRSGTVEEREADFVVFNPRLGILCIEAKSGQVRYSGGAWRYATGLAMSHGGPYSQANGVKHHIMRKFEELGLADLEGRCKFLHAVWFVTLSRHSFFGVDLPPESTRDITLFLEDVSNPEPRIREIMSLSANGYETSLTDSEAQMIVQGVLCPEFSIVPTKRMRYDVADASFARLLDSQIRVLDFIRDQRSAVINGAAGTGKTLIAMERARMAANTGRVLFLCFNVLLKEHISRMLEDEPSIDVYTIAGYACSICSTAVPDYDALAMSLLGMQDRGAFPYVHVIVDEGQDFGIADIENAGILDLLRDMTIEACGTFYVFYDRRQFVQGSSIPSFIDQADCKLTLYINCRNTEPIARCSMRSIGDYGAAEVVKGAKTSGPPQLFASVDASEQERYVEHEIRCLCEQGLDDIVILTCKTVQNSKLSAKVIGAAGHELWAGTKVRFTTVRRFKGLEADAVILVDVDEEVWAKALRDYDPAPGLLFYTGASRAKHELRIVCDMDEVGAIRVLEQLGIEGKRKPVSKLAKALNAINVS